MAPTVPQARTLVISPHYDDAVLSCWALLDRPEGVATDVLTVCGGVPNTGVSQWDLECGFQSGSEAAAARCHEDQTALAGTASHIWALPVLDSAYGQREPGKADALISEAVRGWVTEHSDVGTELTVAIPAGAGIRFSHRAPNPAPQGRGGPALAWLRAVKHARHVRAKRRVQSRGLLAHTDHLMTRDAALTALWPDERVALLVYEELPYLWWFSADAAVAESAARLGAQTEMMAVPVNRVRKAAAIQCYASQLAALDRGSRRLESAETLPADERYWRLTRR